MAFLARAVCDCGDRRPLVLPKNDLSRFWSVLVMALCVPLSSEAQEIPTRVRQVSVDLGLPDPIVTTITQDKRGFLWVGTTSGLARFDGSAVTAFWPDPTDPSAFPPGTVRDLIVTRDDALWAAVEGSGVVVLNPERTEFVIHRSRPGDSTSLSSVDVKQLIEDRRGRVWVGLQNATVAVFDRSTGTFTGVELGERREPSGVYDRIGAFAEGSDGRMWVGTYGGGLYYVHPETLESVRVPLDYGARAAPPAVRALRFESEDDLWIGTGGAGIARLDTNTLEATWLRADAPSGRRLSSDDVMAFVDGRDGVVWAATYGGGLNRIDPRSGAVEWLIEPLADRRVVDLLVAHDGGFWMATWGGGLLNFKPPMDAFHTLLPQGAEEAPGPFDVTALAVSADPDRVWVAAYGRGIFELDLTTGDLRRSEAQPFERAAGNPQLICVLEASDGSVYVGSLSEGLAVLRPGGTSFEMVLGDWVSGATVPYLHEDADGRLWIATRVGLGVMESPADEPHAVPLHFLDSDLAEPSIRRLLSGPDGSLLVGTEIGLAVMDPSTGRGRWLFGGRPDEGADGGAEVSDHVTDLARLRTERCGLGCNQAAWLVSARPSIYSTDRSRRWSVVSLPRNSLM